MGRPKKNKKETVRNIKPRGKPSLPKADIKVRNDRKIAFECSCGYILYFKEYKNKNIDDIQISNYAVTYIINGCGKCGKIQRELRDYLMVIKKHVIPIKTKKTNK